MGPTGPRARCSGGSLAAGDPPCDTGFGARSGLRASRAQAVVTGGTDSTSGVNTDVSLDAPRPPPRAPH